MHVLQYLTDQCIDTWKMLLNNFLAEIIPMLLLSAFFTLTAFPPKKFSYISLTSSWLASFLPTTWWPRVCITWRSAPLCCLHSDKTMMISDKRLLHRSVVLIVALCCQKLCCVKSICLDKHLIQQARKSFQCLFLFIYFFFSRLTAPQAERKCDLKSLKPTTESVMKAFQLMVCWHNNNIMLKLYDGSPMSSTRSTLW